MSARQPIDPAWWDTEHIDGVPMRHALAERDIKSERYSERLIVPCGQGHGCHYR